MPFYDKIINYPASRRVTRAMSVSAHRSCASTDDDDDSTSVKQLTTTPLMRTPLLILDYAQFMAAAIIQRNWRLWHHRRYIEKRWKAAITIQKWWRGFYMRKSYKFLIEQKLQDAIMAHYNKAATKIQALYRGWWTRQTVQDMGGKRKLQHCAVEDLLHCVAYKLHHMLRTYSIPGVYSLANSHCLSRVEKLLAGMKYRFFNAEVRHRMIQRDNAISRQRKYYKDSQFVTAVPFTGPNYKGGCKTHCEEFINRTKDMDRLMYKIITAYDESQRDGKNEKSNQTIAERKRRKQIQKILERKEKTNMNFCGDVIYSMRRWNIWNDKHLTIDKDIFRTPQKLEAFLSEVLNAVAELPNCHCQAL